MYPRKSAYAPSMVISFKLFHSEKIEIFENLEAPVTKTNSRESVTPDSFKAPNNILRRYLFFLAVSIHASP